MATTPAREYSDPTPMFRFLAIAGVLLLSPLVSHATVYSWRGEGGVLMMSNNPDDVPEDKRGSAQTFTSKPAPKRAERAEEPADASAVVDAYERGFDRGLAAAERQLSFAERLAASAPPPPPVPIVVQAPAAPAPDYGYDYPDYDYPPDYPPGYPPLLASAYAPWAVGYYPFGVVGRVAPHRRFPRAMIFPGRRFGHHFPRTGIGRTRRFLAP